jgi:hypothetical protein
MSAHSRAQTNAAPASHSSVRSSSRQAPGLSQHNGQLTSNSRATEQAEPVNAPPIVEEVLRSPGRALDAATRGFMESRFGHDFSRVRVHTDARANESARAVKAAAFTAGSDIVFGPGDYSPQTPRGRHLITHELVHVIQHRAGRAHAGAPLSSAESDPAERQADGAALRVESGLPAGVGQPAAPSSHLSLTPEVWYRGEIKGGKASKDAAAGTRGVVHDLGDGQYYTDAADVAEAYGEMRAADDPSIRIKLGGVVDPHALGRVLDLTKEPDFMFIFNLTRKSMPKISGEPYRNILNHFLARKGIKLEDYDMIIAPEGVREGKQMCVRTPEVLAKIRAAMSPLKPGETVRLPGAAAATPPPAAAQNMAMAVNPASAQPAAPAQAAAVADVAAAQAALAQPPNAAAAAPAANVPAAATPPAVRQQKVETRTTTDPAKAARHAQELVQQYGSRLDPGGNGLAELFNRSAHLANPQLRRAAANELHIITRYLERGAPDGRQVSKITVIPSAKGQTTPDLFIEYTDGTSERLEATTITSSPAGRVAQQPTTFPGNKRGAGELVRKTGERIATLTDVKEAIRRKAVGSKLQLNAPMTGVAPGGTVEIGIPFGLPDPRVIDQALKDLAGNIHANVRGINFTYTDRDEAGHATRKSRFYARQSNTFVLTPQRSQAAATPAVTPPVAIPPATARVNVPPVVALPPVIAAPPVVAPAPPVVAPAPPVVAPAPPVVAPAPPVVAAPPSVPVGQGAATGPRVQTPRVRVGGPRIRVDPTAAEAQQAALAEMEALAEQEAAEAGKAVARARMTTAAPSPPSVPQAPNRSRITTGRAGPSAVDPLDALAIAEQKAAEVAEGGVAKSAPRVRIGTGAQSGPAQLRPAARVQAAAAGKPTLDPLDALAIAEQEAAEKSARALPRVRIGSGAAKPSAAPALKPSAAGAKAPAPPTGVVEAPVGGASGGGARPRVTPGRIGIGIAKAVGPMVLDMLNRYQMAKAESERAVALIDKMVESENVKATIASLIERQRLDIARKQRRGVKLYGTIHMTLRFTNDVLDTLRIDRIEIGDVNRNTFMSAVMSHDLFGAEGKNWWVETSIEVDPVELSPTEEAATDLEIAEEKGHAPMSMNEETLARSSKERNHLIGALSAAKREEAKEKQEALESPAILADDRKRGQQQSEITDRLNQLAGQQKVASPPPAKKAAAPTPPPVAAPSLTPAPPAAQQTQLLPGMPSKGPIEVRMQAVAEARAEARRVLGIGRALANRLGSDNSPTNAERQSFSVAEEMWRNAVKFMQNKFTADKYHEPASALGELIDRYGPMLKEIRTRLGG